MVCTCIKVYWIERIRHIVYSSDELACIKGGVERASFDMASLICIDLSIGEPNMQWPPRHIDESMNLELF